MQKFMSPGLTVMGAFQRRIMRMISGSSAAARRRRLCQAWCILFFERFWRRFMPLLLTVLVFASCCWLNLFALLPVVAHGAVLALFAAVFAAAFALLCGLPLPSAAAAQARLEHDSGLCFGELGLTRQKLAPGASPAAVALWRAHKRQSARRAQDLKLKAPRPNIPAYDRVGLRAALFLLFAVAYMFQLGAGGGSLGDAFYFGAARAPAEMRIDAWISPPEWTQRPPVYLESGAKAARISGAALPPARFSVPAGSVLTVRANDGGRGLVRLACAAAEGGRAPHAASRHDGGSTVYSLRISASVQCRLRAPFGAAVWNIAAEPDKAPQIAWAKPPERALNGALKLSYTIYDDYGISKAWAEITPLDDAAAAPRFFARLIAPPQVLKQGIGSVILWRGAPPPQGGNTAAAGRLRGQTAPLIAPPQINLRLPPPHYDARLGLRGGAAQTEADFTQSPWGGAYVALRLAAEDKAGQRTESRPVRLVLPQKIFVSPLARALSEQRRLLAENADNAARVADMLNALLLWPEKTIPDKGAVLALYSLRARLARLRQQAQGEAQAEGYWAAGLRDIAAYMGAIAAGIDGDKAAAAYNKLRQAMRALREGLRNGASAEELAKLMQNLRSAMQDYIAMLAERGEQAQGLDRGGKMLGENDLQKRLQALEEAARQGQRGAAEQMLSDFGELMKNLRVAQGGAGGGLPAGKTGRQSQMQQQMDALSDIMRRQQQLLDDTHKNNERKLRGDEGGSQEQNSGGGLPRDKDAGGRQSLTERQDALRRELDNVQKELQNQRLSPQGGFAEAQRQMQGGAEALGRGDLPAAQQNEAEALQALRDGAQKVMEQMRAALAADDAAAGGQKDGQNGAAQAQAEGRGDPLGRPLGAGQADGSDSLPLGERQARARRILEEIRKKLGNLTPKQEKEYLERLLNYE